MNIKIAAMGGMAVFAACWVTLITLHYMGNLDKFAEQLPGLKYLIDFGFIGTPAVVPGLATYWLLILATHLRRNRK